jgi:hypothetical protein
MANGKKVLVPNEERIKQLALVIEDRAQIGHGFVELRTKPHLPRIVHEEFGGGYQEFGKGRKCRGRVRLYGAKAMNFLALVLPYFVTPRKAEAEAILKTWHKCNDSGG